MTESSAPDPTITVLAAMIEGERWLSADSCAVLLGLTTPDGKPNRRGFLERLACHPSFPAPLQIGNEKKWKRSEVLRWADDQRRVTRQ